MEQVVPQIETLNTESPSPKSHVSRNQTLLHLESPKFLHDFDGQAWSLRTVAAREAGKNGSLFVSGVLMFGVLMLLLTDLAIRSF